jgi:hypothetical protein
MTDDLLNQGIAALKAGRKAEARGLLAQLVEQEPRHELGWLWLSGAVDTDEDRRVCLENVLAINPNNETAKRGLPSLVVQESAPARESLANGFGGDDVFQPTEQPDTGHLTSTIQDDPAVTSLASDHLADLLERQIGWLEKLDVSVVNLSVEVKSLNDSLNRTKDQLVTGSVRVSDFDISFGSLLSVMFKWVFASIVLGIVFFLLWGIFVFLLSSI